MDGIYPVHFHFAGICRSRWEEGKLNTGEHAPLHLDRLREQYVILQMDVPVKVTFEILEAGV